MPDKRLVIIDGYSLLFRAFYGTRFLSTSDGRPTNALFGFVSMLFTLLTDVKPDAMVVALDAPGKTFRHTDYAEYKGTRRETPSELASQLEFSRELIADLNIPVYEVTGYEADDIVGTISRQAEENGYFTTIVTGDLDSLQLVDECVSVMTTKRGVTDVIVYNVEGVQLRYGFGPEHVTDYKALVGDTSDNIKGVPGIGEKSATQLIQTFGSIEDMLSRFDEVEEKFRKKIEPHIEEMKFSKWLATIVRDAPIDYDFAPYRVTASHVEKAKLALSQLEFRNHLKKLDQVLAPYRSDGAADLTIASVDRDALTYRAKGGDATMESLEAWVDGQPFGLHFEPRGATQKSMFDEEVSENAFIAKGDEVWSVPASLGLALFERHPELAVGHETKAWYHKVQPTAATPRFDTMLAGYVLQSGRTAYALSDFVQGYLDVAAPAEPEQSAVALLRLEEEMSDRLEKEGQTRVFRDIELALVPILAEMERFGVRVNGDFLRDFSKSIQVDIERVQKEIYELAGEEFNIGSPKQIGEVLFEKMGIPGVKKTKTGYATGVEILSELAPAHPIAGEILTYRELTKLKSTYADSLPKMVAADGRIHTTYNQGIAATGRLSSIDPNLQNIPIRTELGRQIRRAFVAGDGYDLLSFDYSQIELRILAHMCRDEALVEAFQSRVDVHTITASLMFNVEAAEVTKEQRRLAKMLNYAVLYGVTDFGLANQLGQGFGVHEAHELISQYNIRFPKVKAFTERMIDEARAKGFTVTMCGRRRYFPDIHAGNRATRLYAERQAINAPIQGTAADMIKIAMIDVRELLGDSGTRMLLQVHDELVFEIPPTEHGQVEPIRRAMEDAIKLDVPIEVDAKAGANWLEMTPL